MSDRSAWTRWPGGVRWRWSAQVIRSAGVAIDIVDVGGGFPVAYPDVAPPPLGAFIAEIEDGFERLGLPAATRLWAEPGRALVAGGGSVVVQVQLAARRRAVCERRRVTAAWPTPARSASAIRCG